MDTVNPPKLEVWLNGDPNCYNVSVPCKKTLGLIVDGVEVHLGARTSTSFNVTVNNEPIHLPRTTSDPTIKEVSEWWRR